MSAGGADVPAAGRTSRLIFQQYPAPIRRLYATVVTERSPAARHAKLCKLGEGTLAYLASMALSDYRNRRHADPDPKVESVLAGMKRISMGQYLQIFRVATDAIQPALFDYKLSRPDSCPAISRFCAAYSAIEEAIELEAQNLRKIVSQRLEAPRRSPGWPSGSGSSSTATGPRLTRPPITGRSATPDYYPIMTPILESALVEALTAPHVERVFRDHPVATLANITYGQDRYLHEVAGEDLGLPFEAVISLDRSVTDVWSQDAWKARPGSALMLARLPSGAYEISGLMHDLAASGPPVVPRGRHPERAARRGGQHAVDEPVAGRDEDRGGNLRRARAGIHLAGRSVPRDLPDRQDRDGHGHRPAGAGVHDHAGRSRAQQDRPGPAQGRDAAGAGAAGDPGRALERPGRRERHGLQHRGHHRRFPGAGRGCRPDSVPRSGREDRDVHRVLRRQHVSRPGRLQPEDRRRAGAVLLVAAVRRGDDHPAAGVQHRVGELLRQGTARQPVRRHPRQPAHRSRPSATPPRSRRPQPALPASTSGSSPTRTTRCWKTEPTASAPWASMSATPAPSWACCSTRQTGRP